MKRNLTFGLFFLVLAASSAFAATVVNSVLVTTNQLIIPYTGLYATNRPVKLGNYTLLWQQAGKGSNIVATLPANIPTGTYALTLQGATAVDVEIGSVTGVAALNARVDAETTRAGNAEAGLTNAINAEVIRATAAEAGLSNNINAEITRATGAETGLAKSINATSNNIVANFTGNINSISNGLIAGVASSFNAASNSIVTALASNVNATSNSIVANLTKNFTTAYAFGPLTLNPYSSVSFSSFIGNWTTNGTDFKIPANGVYQISFAINPVTSSGATRLDIEINVSNNTGTNGVGYFTGPLPFSLSGQITIQCYQGDQISIYNAIGNQITCRNAGSWIDVATNVPCATLSIIQIQ